MTDNAKEIKLDCGHSIWLKSPWPNVGERLWCAPCHTYEFVGPMHEMQTIYHDTWRSVKDGRVYRGECLGEDGRGCIDSYLFKGVNFYSVQTKLENHYIRKHANSSLIFGEPIELAQPLPKGSPPPF